MKTLIIIPAFNEEENIIQLINKIRNISNSHKYVITANQMYHPCHLLYHGLPQSLPHVAKAFTKTFKTPI